jgi:hypothetical protein
MRERLPLGVTNDKAAGHVVNLRRSGDVRQAGLSASQVRTARLARRATRRGRLIIVVLANAEAQEGPQDAEYDDKAEAQQSNDDDEDQGRGHSADIVAAWILDCHRGPLPTSLMGAARARRGIPSRDGKRMDGPRPAQRSTPQFRHSNGVTGSRRARWVSIYRLLTHSPSSTLPRSWGHSRALSSPYEARWHVFGAAAVSGRPGAAGSQSAAGRCWRDGLRGHRCG